MPVLNGSFTCLIDFKSIPISEYLIQILSSPKLLISLIPCSREHSYMLNIPSLPPPSKLHPLEYSKSD